MTFKISKEAVNDLRSIGQYTQQKWGKHQRREYLFSLNEKFSFLANNPLMCRERTEFDPSVRIHRHKHHLIIYLVNTDHILILRILHENMDIDAQLK